MEDRVDKIINVFCEFVAFIMIMLISVTVLPLVILSRILKGDKEIFK